MDGIEKIIARIDADTDTQAREIIARANAQAEEIAAAYSQSAQDEYWKLIQAGAKDCEARVARLESACEMEAKKSVLSLKQEMVAAAFAEAKNILRGLPENQYAELLSSLCVKAARTGNEVIILDPADKGGAAAKTAVTAANAELAFKKGLLGMLSVSDETRSITGGLILKDGDIEINCGINALVEMSKNELSAQVAEVLFE